MKRTALLAAALFTAVASTAIAQPVPSFRDRATQPVLGVESIRVQVTLNYFVPGPAGDSEEANRLRDRARRSLYEMATRECTLMLEVIASECKLEAINVNINRHPGQQPEGFQAGANMTYRITLK
jgi:hypothetical protein